MGLKWRLISVLILNTINDGLSHMMNIGISLTNCQNNINKIIQYEQKSF